MTATSLTSVQFCTQILIATKNKRIGYVQVKIISLDVTRVCIRFWNASAPNHAILQLQLTPAMRESHLNSNTSNLNEIVLAFLKTLCTQAHLDKDSKDISSPGIVQPPEVSTTYCFYSEQNQQKFEQSTGTSTFVWCQLLLRLVKKWGCIHA